MDTHTIYDFLQHVKSGTQHCKQRSHLMSHQNQKMRWMVLNLLIH